MQNIFTKITQKNTNGSINNVICNSAQKGLIPQREYFDKDIANSDNTDGYFVIKKGDFVYNPRKSVSAPYGPVSVYNYDDDGIVSPLYLCFRAKETINTNFYEWYFKSAAWHRYIYLYGDSGVRHDRVSIKDSTFFEMPLHIPCVAKQKKIAHFLAILDSYIHKQHQLVDVLKSYKRGLESIIFNAKYENTFCLSDILIEHNERSTVNNQYPVISSTKQGLFMQSEYFNKQAASLDTKDYKILRRNQIVLSPQNLWMGNINYNNKYNIGIVSPSYKIYNIQSEFDGKYIGYLMRSNCAIKEYILVSEQGASIVRRNLNMDLFYAIKFSIPDIKKQSEFSCALEKIDLIINKQIEVLSNLLLIKKELLQQLFI